VAPVHSTNTTPIQDANNPAPIVKSDSTTTQAAQTRRARTTAKAAGTQHARRHTRNASHS
jgi:hypothetical protein